MTQQGDTTSQHGGSGPQPGQGQERDATSHGSEVRDTLAGDDSSGTTVSGTTASGTTVSGPSWPSPYLPAGQAVPEAYAAPPRPGQPKYGSPAGAPVPPRPFGSGPAGSGRPGYSQPANGKPGYGQPGPTGRGRRGYAARSAAADPALAGFGERLLASTVDWILILLAAFVAELEPLVRLVRELESVLRNAQYVSRAAYNEALTAVLQAPGTGRALLTFWLIAFGLALAYFWVLPAIGGATLGKRLVGLRVVNAADRSAVGVRSAGIRAVALLAGPAIFVLAPTVELLGLLLWLGDGLAPLLDASRMQCLHDRLAGTAVVRKRWLDQQRAAAPPATPW